MLPRSKPLLAFLVAFPLLLLVWMWQLAQKRPRLVGALNSPASALALSRDGSSVAIATEDGTFGIWERGDNRLRSLQSESKIIINPRGVAPIAVHPDLQFSPDDGTIFGSDIRVAVSSTGLYAWDAKTHKIKWSAVSEFNDDFAKFWPSPDGKRVAQRSYDVEKVFDISGVGGVKNSKVSKFARSFPVLARFQIGKSQKNLGHGLAGTLALSPDGKTLAVANGGHQLEFWDVGTGKQQSQTTLPRAAAISDGQMQYSPDGRFVASFDGTQLSLWDMTTRKWTNATMPTAMSSFGASLAWMPDSRSLWTGAATVQQWSAPELKPLRELPIDGTLAVSGDGRTLATRSLETSDVPSGVWLWNIG